MTKIERERLLQLGAPSHVPPSSEMARAIQNSRRPFGANKRGAAARLEVDLSVRESEQRFRAIVEQSVAAVYVIQDGKLVYINPRMRELFGYGAEEPFDPDPLAYLKESERARVVEKMRDRMAGKGEPAYSVIARRKDGTEFTLGLHASLIAYNGNPAIIAIAQDITERERAQTAARQHLERLERAMRGTIGVISTIIEFRDPYTHGHERRVGEIAAAIATEMALDPDRVEGIRVAGNLHDVGKIGAPAELLAKPTRLSPAEYALIKGHAQSGYEILKGVDFPWPVALVALQHHERLDGSGYPQGLKNGAIILEARIMAVADTVEAMSSHRPYRPGLGIDKALAEIERGRGVQYDADAAEACLRLFRERDFKLPA